MKNCVDFKVDYSERSTGEPSSSVAIVTMAASTTEGLPSLH